MRASPLFVGRSREVGKLHAFVLFPLTQVVNYDSRQRYAVFHQIYYQTKLIIVLLPTINMSCPVTDPEFSEAK